MNKIAINGNRLSVQCFWVCGPQYSSEMIFKNLREKGKRFWIAFLSAWLENGWLVSVYLLCCLEKWAVHKSSPDLDTEILASGKHSCVKLFKEN